MINVKSSYRRYQGRFQIQYDTHTHSCFHESPSVPDTTPSVKYWWRGLRFICINPTNVNDLLHIGYLDRTYNVPEWLGCMWELFSCTQMIMQLDVGKTNMSFGPEPAICDVVFRFYVTVFFIVIVDVIVTCDHYHHHQQQHNHHHTLLFVK